MLDVSPRPLDHFHLRSTENKINRNSRFKFPIPPVRKVFFQVLKIYFIVYSVSVLTEKIFKKVGTDKTKWYRLFCPKW